MACRARQLQVSIAAMIAPELTDDTWSRKHADIEPTCLLCGAELIDYLRGVRDAVTWESFQILRCPQCGLGQTVPRPRDLSRYYRNYHGDRHAFTSRYCARRRLALVRRVAGSRGANRRLLDIGCGDGTFMLEAKQGGWDVMGTEMNPDLPRRRELNVVADLSELQSDATFECVTLWHSLEHLSDPLDTILRLRRLISVNGVLIIAVPDYGGLQAWLFADKWLHLDVPRHLFHFNIRALSRLLNSAGFSPERWWHQEFEYDLMGWSQSALNKLMPAPNVFFDLVPGRSTEASATEKILNWAGGIVLSAIGVPFVLTSSLIRRGGTLVVAARPDLTAGNRTPRVAHLAG